MLCVVSYSQLIADTINEEDAKRHINYLASDKLRGRVNFTKEQLEAAEYISKEFTSYGLVPFSDYPDFYQPFMCLPGKVILLNNAKEKLTDSVLYNVVGVLPGKDKSDEIIIFSAHYDHVSDGPFGQIFNGANDNASGTTAVLMLAKYFSMRQDNERTIVFCLFAGEELGLLGSAAFVKLIEPDKVKAVINIEMIGKTNWAGKNCFAITGAEYSDLNVILKKNLKGGKIKITYEGANQSGLFRRSDNYSFALKGIPAHSIMCSDDKDPCYHKPCDDAKWINTKNMTNIIKAIAKGCTTLISGENTPRRIKL